MRNFNHINFLIKSSRWFIEGRMIGVFQTILWKNAFSPHNVLRELDTKGGVLNYTGIGLLRKVETSWVKCSSAILPSRSSLQKYSRKIELIAQELYHVAQYEKGNELGE